MRKTFTNLFTVPDAKALAERELAEAQRELLAAQSAQEYARSQVEFNQSRVERLTAFLKGGAA